MAEELSRKRRRVFRFPDIGAILASRGWTRVELLKSLPLDLSSDPLREAISFGIAAGNGKRKPTQEVRARARAIRDRARATSNHKLALSELLGFVQGYPSIEEFQKIIARLLHETHEDQQALRAWLGISLRFPLAMDALHNLALLSHRQSGADAVRTVLHARFSRMPMRLDQLLAYAELCDKAGAIAERKAAFDRLAQMFEKRRESWLLTASWLEEEIGLNRSLTAFFKRLAAGAGLRPPAVSERRRLQAIVSDREHGDIGGLDKGPAKSVRVLGALFDRVIEERQIRTGQRPRDMGSAVLLTGSLGMGGAERQVVNTAVALHRMSLEQRTLRGGVTLNAVNVMARSLRDRNDGSFFLVDLHRAGVPVRSYRELPDFAGNLGISAVRPALSALGFLPWSTAEAVIKLTDWLQATRPEVVHIWQDGLVYAAGLAALLAGIPRIILSGRSTPPPDRRERYPIEYDIIYKSLLRAPGVILSVNSRYAAGRYASWLSMDEAKISVIPNGVELASAAGDTASEAMFKAFDAVTGQCQFTLGAVMRLDEVKRPMLWIEAAASILSRIPNARFIIVGDGPFRARMERRADALGIAGRCLFVGRSNCVGYWLSKLNALMLLSQHEGLPNALIEAQLAGVPVISTPIGGAPETFIPSVTGIATSINPTPREISDVVANLKAQEGCLEKMGIAAAQWASETFPIARMLSNTMEVYSSAGWSEPWSVENLPHVTAIGEPRFRYVG